MNTAKKSLLTLLALGASAFAALAQNAAVATNVIAESSVQYSATGATSFTNYASGYDKLKYSTTTTSCKTYFKFDFTGLNPNTNYNLKFFWTQVANNSAQHLQLWALNQAYPGFSTNGNVSGVAAAAVNPSLTWSGAQANDTSAVNNDLLTSGAASATLITDVSDPGANSGTFGGTIPAPWGQYLFNNQIVIVLSVTNDPVDASNGGRLALGVTTATVQPLTAGTLPPSISSFTNVTLLSGTPSASIPFTVSDPLDAAAALNNITISLGNTNITLTASNVTAGAGGNRTLTFTPVSNLAVGKTANVTVTVTVTDSSGNSASSSFQLTVLPVVTAPVILSGTNANYLPPTSVVGAGSVTIPFQVWNTMTNLSATNLILAGAASPYSTNLGVISFTATNVAPNTNNCTLTVAVTGAGVGIVSVSVIDTNDLVTNTVPVAVMVLPGTNYAAYDLMQYQPSTSYSSSSGHSDLVNASAGLWAARSTSGSVNLITSLTPSSGGQVPVGVPLIRGTASGNPNQLRLAGAPYTNNSHQVLFACVKAQWCDVSPYGANYYYPGASAGGFVEFAADGNASGVAMAQVCTVTNAANTATNSGAFYLGLYNGTNSPSLFTGYQETILDSGVNGIIDPVDNIEMSYDLDTGISRLWVNAANSAATSASLQDVAVTNLANVSYLVLRQNALMGQILIEGASVKAVTKTGVVAGTPSITGVSVAGGNMVIRFTSTSGAGAAAYCAAVDAATVNGTYAADGSFVIQDLGGGNYSATAPVSGATRFCRITQTPSGGTTPTVSFPF